MTRSVAAVLLATVTLPAPAAERPNFVFVFADDQRYDAMSCVQKEQGEKGRFPWLKTPNMDRLADGGVRFRNAFVVNSLCSPSRACFLTGRYSHANGIWNNTTPFPKDSVTHATLLKAAGYTTGYVGKWHMGTQPDRPGFDWFASFTGQGTFEAAKFLVNGKLESKPGWVDDQSTDYAVEFLKAHKDRPFSLVVGFKAAHGPFEPPARWKDQYDGELARRTPNYALKPGFNPDLGGGAKLPDGEKVPVNLGYLRCVSAIDENLGKLLDTLDSLKLTDNTVVVYSSDNGFYLGEHSLADKRSAYEESLRIPFIVRYPKLVKKAAVRDEMVLNVDLAPTLLDLAGVPIPKEMHGRSWKPLLSDDKAKEWRQSWLYTYFYEPGGASAAANRNPGGYNTPTHTAVRTPTSKLIKYAGHDDWTEVFDLVADPYETKNLASDPKHAELRKRLEAEHARLVKELDYKVPATVPKPGALAPIASKDGYVLDYDFSKAGEVKGGTLQGGAKAVDGALAFDGTGAVSVSKSDSLNIADTPFLFEVNVKLDAAKKDGVLIARGGAAMGACVHFADGKPVFTVVLNGKAVTAAGMTDVSGKWATIIAAVTADKAALYVDGKPEAEAKLPGLMARDPNDGLSLGADLGSPVAGKTSEKKLVGHIGRVRVYRGKDLPLPK
jgi:arylsulfatase A-like enzyme